MMVSQEVAIRQSSSPPGDSARPRRLGLYSRSRLKSRSWSRPLLQLFDSLCDSLTLTAYLKSRSWSRPLLQLLLLSLRPRSRSRGLSRDLDLVLSRSCLLCLGLSRLLSRRSLLSWCLQSSLVSQLV